jgi:hypothetical protein
MTASSYLALSLIPSLSGIALHQVFRVIEPPLSILTVSLVSIIPLLGSLIQFRDSGYWMFPLLDYAICYTVWSVSVIIYRLSPIHPLSSFPGPWYLHISKLSNACIYLQGHQHEIFYQLHKKYGPIVRVGPNELSICDASAVKSVLGADGLPKGNCQINF